MEYRDFGWALSQLRAGKLVRRSGWNGKGMWLVLVNGSRQEMREGSPYHNAGLLGKVTIGAHIDMYTAQGTMQPGWLASQADLLAEDWELEDE